MKILLLAALFAANTFAQIYTVSTFAGTDRLLDGSAATSVPFRDPDGLAIDSGGNIYVLDKSDNRVRRIGASGTISTYAGTGQAGFSGDRGKAASARLRGAEAIALDASGNLYIADAGNFRVRKVTLDGIINTVAGNGGKGSSGDGGPATSAQLTPIALTLDTKGNLYISDTGFRIRKVDASGTITTVAGSGTSGFSGDNGPALSAQLGLVTDIAVDASGNLYLADLVNERVRKVDPSGMITTIAGSGDYGTIRDGAQATTAVLLPDALAVDGTVLYIADVNRNVVRRVDLGTGLITTVAGTGSEGFSGDNGPPTSATLNFPGALAIDPAHVLYVADRFNQRVRKIGPTVITTVAGSGNRDGGSAVSAFLNAPSGIAVSPSGQVLIADSGNSEARIVSLDGTVRSIGTVQSAPFGVAVDATGSFYVGDEEPLILKITPTGATTILAGNGNSGYTGDGGPALNANLGTPTGVAVDSFGNVYFTDYDANRIRKIGAGNGIVTTIAGSGSLQASGDGGLATAAGLDAFDIAIDRNNNIYVADQYNNRIRKITPDGRIATVAGDGTAGYSGDGGPAIHAQLTAPSGVAIDNAGNVLIADLGNAAIRRVSPGGLITTIAGSGLPTPSSGDGGPALSANFDPFRLAVDAAGAIYVSDLVNDRVRKLTPVVVSKPAVSIVGGNNQTAAAGTLLKSSLTIKVTDATGTVIPGVEVLFTVSPAGAATLSQGVGVTLPDGTASTDVTLGPTAGPVTVTASVAGAAPLTFNITAASPTAPVIAPGGVASAGLSVPAVLALAPNGIASIFGQRFAPDGTARQVSGDDLIGGRLPVNLAGVCVLVGSQRAPVLNVYPNQLNIQVPAIAPGAATLQVISNCDLPNQETSNAIPVTIQIASPEFFYFQQNANGHNPIAAINAVTGAFVNGTPAKSGDVLTLFATGFGATTPAFSAGELPNVAAPIAGDVSVTFGGIPLSAADILYAGASQIAGVYQLSIRVPAGVSGDAAVVVTISGKSSPAGGFITVAP